MTNELQLHQISVSEMDNNCYLLTAGDEGLLVDAADDAPAILDMAREAGVDITAVLTTHRHWDHVRALGEVLEATNAKHYASFIDSPAIPEDVDVELREGDSIDFAGMKLPIIILRGHTPGGVALVATVDGVTNLFVGESFPWIWFQHQLYCIQELQPQPHRAHGSCQLNNKGSHCLHLFI